MAKETAHRQFYNFEKDFNEEFSVNISEETEKNDLFKYVNDNIIGSQTIFSSPFGPRKGKVFLLFIKTIFYFLTTL